MPSVLAHMTMSLDGFVATPDDQVGALFDWYSAGSIEVVSANPAISFRLDEPGAEMMGSLLTSVGALVTGRRLFDLTGGWGDRHPIGAPVVVVTHRAPGDPETWPTTRFVSSIEQAVAVAGEIATDRDVALSSANIIGQALDAGLVDEVAVSLVPLLMGSGKAYFGSLTRAPVFLDDPTVIAGRRATHLRYRVRR